MPAVTVLVILPSTLVDSPLLEALRTAEGQKQARIVDVLIARRMTAAVSPLLELANTAKDDDSSNTIFSALVALGDEKSLSSLVALLPHVNDAQHRDRLEMAYRDIAWKCGNNIEPILAAMKDDATTAALLPLLGRVGGDAARRKIDEALASNRDDLKAAGLRALCNWPDDSVADRLSQLAEQASEPDVRISALRAYIRVVSIESSRSATDTLAMLQKGYKMAQRVEERRLAVERAKMARHIRTLRWLAGLLDDAAVREAACTSIVELAHHRELRNPNRGEFAAALKKVIAMSKNEETVRRAKGYLEGV